MGAIYSPGNAQEYDQKNSQFQNSHPSPLQMMLRIRQSIVESFLSFLCLLKCEGGAGPGEQWESGSLFTQAPPSPFWTSVFSSVT